MRALLKSDGNGSGVTHDVYHVSAGRSERAGKLVAVCSQHAIFGFSSRRLSSVHCEASRRLEIEFPLVCDCQVTIEVFGPFVRRTGTETERVLIRQGIVQSVGVTDENSGEPASSVGWFKTSGSTDKKT